MNDSTVTRTVFGILIACASCTGSELGPPPEGPVPTSVGSTTGSQASGAFSNSGASGQSAVSNSASRATGGSQPAGVTSSGGATTDTRVTSAIAPWAAGARELGGASYSNGGANLTAGGRETMGGAGTTRITNAIGGALLTTKAESAFGGAAGTSGASAIGAAGKFGTAQAGIGAAGSRVTTNAGASAGGSASTLAGGNASSAGTSSATPSPGCGKSPSLASGSLKIQSGGESRQYMLRIPENYDKSHPYRLVFAFHWNGGTMNDIDGGGSSGYAWSYYGLREQANNSTLFVAPQGIGNGWANSGGRDLTLVDDLIKLIESDLCVDTSQLFSVGFSYGGGMTYELACARATVFRAVAVYSGAQLSGCDGGKQPVAYLGIHGVSDGTCNISGGRALRDTFVKNNGCSSQNPTEPASGSLKHVCTSYQGCKTGYPVEWCAFDGGHTPGNVDGGGDDGAKTWTKTEVWKFFTQFSSTL